MADVEELLDGVPVRLAPAQAVRARGERRRARQRMGGVVAVAVIAATAVGIGSWTDPTPGPRGSQVASEGENPFMSHGVVQDLKPSELPRYAALHWKGDEKASDASALPQAGLDSVCNGRPGGVRAPEQQFTHTYSGKGDARARHRVAQYANTAEALDAVRRLGETLGDCGLKEHKGGGYSGPTNGNGRRLEVSVQRWGAWVRVVETQYSPPS
ncbi:hypothetical protein OG883_29570 [Streptomyces sp. NBC_01142]|uniref:hypothetical protein n=1 Tax=Streptomyces sp. NBC_01142 TaxID=2975865 RepID=UPI00224EC05C|nr:hypothetical protein [Streptomyces sp. NBC_01142]MCX4823951.1 hypothetical protein [Streptomyces sp. NBC_01142]